MDLTVNTRVDLQFGSITLRDRSVVISKKLGASTEIPLSDIERLFYKPPQLAGVVNGYLAFDTGGLTEPNALKAAGALFTTGIGFGRESVTEILALKSAIQQRIATLRAAGDLPSRERQAAPAPPLVSLKGRNGQLEVTSNAVVIRRAGVMGFMSHPTKGEKSIPLESITAIQLKKPGLTAGYIQFSIAGGLEARGGVFDATRDENTILCWQRFRPVR